MKMTPADYMSGLDTMVHHMAVDVMSEIRRINDTSDPSYAKVSQMAHVADRLQEILSFLGVEHSHQRKD